jgi:hypothetical protein
MGEADFLLIEKAHTGSLVQESATTFVNGIVTISRHRHHPSVLSAGKRALNNISNGKPI